MSPPRSCPSPAPLGPQLGEEAGPRKDEGAPGAAGARSPSVPGAALWAPGGRTARAVCSPGRPAPGLPFLPRPGPVPLFKYPSSAVTAAAAAAGSRGCPLSLRGPRLDAPAPLAGKTRRAPRRPLPAWPAGAAAVRRHACARPRPHARAQGAWEPGQRVCSRREARSPGRSAREHGHRDADATITVKTNPRPRSPPARPTRGGRGTPQRHWLEEETTRWTPHPWRIHRDGDGAGQGAGPREAEPIPLALALPDSWRHQWAGGARPPRTAAPSTSATVHNGPKGRPARRTSQMERASGGNRGARLTENESGREKGNGREDARTREVTNRSGRVGVYGGSGSRSRLGPRGGTSCLAHLPRLLFHSNRVVSG